MDDMHYHLSLAISFEYSNEIKQIHRNMRDVFAKIHAKKQALYRDYS
jgi:hypothetical protein